MRDCVRPEAEFWLSDTNVGFRLGGVRQDLSLNDRQRLNLLFTIL